MTSTILITLCPFTETTEHKPHTLKSNSVASRNLYLLQYASVFCIFDILLQTEETSLQCEMNIDRLDHHSSIMASIVIRISLKSMPKPV
jgi:hypothetical protein